MITANTKITALEILRECGIENPEEKFGKVRVRIGGIAGINDPKRLINIQPGAKNLEVIVGADIYDLELAKGDSENNSKVFVVTEEAQNVLQETGREATVKAERLQKVKMLARKIKEAEVDGAEYVAKDDEEELMVEALDLVDAQRESLEDSKEKVKPIKVKSE